MGTPTNNNTGSSGAIVPYHAGEARKPKRKGKKAGQKHVQPEGINALSGELFERIFSFLSPRELGQVTCVNKIWHTLADKNCIWMNHCLPFISVKETKDGLEITWNKKLYKLNKDKYEYLFKTIYETETRKETKPRKLRREFYRNFEKPSSVNQDSWIFSLPPETLLILMSYLSSRDLTSLACTSRLVPHLTDDHHLWINHCINEGFLFLQKEGDVQKILYKGKKLFLGAEPGRAKKLFLIEMKHRMNQVATQVLSPYVEELSTEKTLLSPPFYDTKKKESQIYDSLTIASEALIKKYEHQQLSEIQRESVAKSLRLVLAFLLQDPKVLEIVLKRDSLRYGPYPQQKQMNAFCEKFKLQTPMAMVARSNNLQLLEIALETGLVPTDKDLRIAIQKSPKISLKLLEQMTPHIRSKDILEACLGLTKSSKEAKEKQREYLKLITTLCDRLQAQNAKKNETGEAKKIYIRNRENRDYFWEKVLQIKNLEIVKKIDACFERPANILNRALDFGSPEIALYFLEENLAVIETGGKGLTISRAGNLKSLWKKALQIKDLELIKKVEASFRAPQSPLKLVLKYGSPEIVSYFLDAKKFSVTAECFQVAFQSGNRELFDQLLKQGAFEANKESAAAAIKGNNLDLVKEIVHRGYKFSLDDLIELHADGQGDKILEFLQESGKLSLDIHHLLSNEEAENIDELRNLEGVETIDKILEIRNHNLIALLYKDGFLGKDKPARSKYLKNIFKSVLIERNKTEILRSLVSQKVATWLVSNAPDTRILNKNMRYLINSYTKIKEKKDPHLHEEYQNQYDHALNNLHLLLAKGIKLEECGHEAITTIFSKLDWNTKRIREFIEKTNLPLPNNTHETLLRRVLFKLELNANLNIKEVKALHHFLISMNISPQKNVLKLLKEEIKKYSTPKKIGKFSDEDFATGFAKRITTEHKRKEKIRHEKLAYLNEVLELFSRTNVEEPQKTDRKKKK